MKAVLTTRSRRKTNKLMQLGGEKHVLSLLKRTDIARSNYPIAIESLREEKDQDEIAIAYGVSRSTVARLKRLALRKLEQFGLTVPSSWSPMEIVMPSPLAERLAHFNKVFEASTNEAAKRELVESLTRAVDEAADTLSKSKQRRGE
jgi:hypothetical protein